MMAGNIGHGLISTGNRKTCLTIRYMPVSWAKTAWKVAGLQYNQMGIVLSRVEI